MRNLFLFICLSFMLIACGGGSTYIDVQDSTSDSENPVTTEPDSVAGSEKFQILDEKLVMKSVDNSTDFLSSEVLTFGSKGQTIPLPGFISLEGDLNLRGSVITGAASRGRVTLEVRVESESTNDFMDLFLAFESRFAGVFSRAFIKLSSGVEVALTNINNLPLTKGVETHFKVEFLNDGIYFAKITIGENSDFIRVSSLTSSDMQFMEGSFNTYVEFPEDGNYAEGSIDNIVLKLNENGADKTIIRDFTGYIDGTAPVADEYFITVSSP